MGREGPRWPWGFSRSVAPVASECDLRVSSWMAGGTRGDVRAVDGGGGSQAGWTGCWLELGVALDTAQTAGGASLSGRHSQAGGTAGGDAVRPDARMFVRCFSGLTLCAFPASRVCACACTVLQPTHTRHLCPQQPAPGHPGAVGPWFRRQPGGPAVRTQPVPGRPSFLCRGSRQRTGAEGPPWLLGWVQPRSRRSRRPPASVQRPPQGQVQPCPHVAAGNSARTWRL